MNIIYNNQEDFARKICEFLSKIPGIRKTQLNIIPFILLGIIKSESLVAADIAKKLKGSFSLVQHDSVIKRIRRFFKNKLFKPYDFYSHIIKYVIASYKKKSSDRRVHIVFDHMFSRDNFTVFMITMRLGKQGIPLWFRCYKGKDCSDAFQESLITEGIDYVSKLFSKDDYDLIFLADRWFGSVSLLKHIEDLGHTYDVRMKGNIKVFYFNIKEGHKIWSTLDELTTYSMRSNFYNDVEITDKQYKTNITISKRKDVKEPKSNNIKTRISSLFNTGLTLFNLAFESSRYIRIPYSFTLYDL